jgi:hypothetical protein
MAISEPGRTKLGWIEGLTNLLHPSRYLQDKLRSIRLGAFFKADNQTDHSPSHAQPFGIDSRLDQCRVQ